MSILDEPVSNELDSTPEFRDADGLTTEVLTSILAEWVQELVCEAWMIWNCCSPFNSHCKMLPSTVLSVREYLQQVCYYDPYVWLL
jgi:hypothetical protein